MFTSVIVCLSLKISVKFKICKNFPLVFTKVFMMINLLKSTNSADNFVISAGFNYF